MLEASFANVALDRKGKFRYTVKAKNNRVVEKAEEGFEHLQYVIERVHGRWPGLRIHVKYVTGTGRPVDYWVEPSA